MTFDSLQEMLFAFEQKQFSNNFVYNNEEVIKLFVELLSYDTKNSWQESNKKQGAIKILNSISHLSGRDIIDSKVLMPRLIKFQMLFQSAYSDWETV